MEKKQPAAYYALLMLTFVFTVLAVVTLLPNPQASKPNVLGYRSVCSFAPAASALCGLLAGVTCTIRNRFISRKTAGRRLAPLAVPIAAAAALLAVAVGFGVRFVRLQSRFEAVIEKTRPSGGPFTSLADGVRRATAAEGEVFATVEVKIVSGKAVGLRLIEGKNVDASLADRLFQAIIAAQSSSVDAISGATASSKVVLAAVAAAAQPGSAPAP